MKAATVLCALWCLLLCALSYDALVLIRPILEA